MANPTVDREMSGCACQSLTEANTFSYSIARYLLLVKRNIVCHSLKLVFRICVGASRASTLEYVRQFNFMHRRI